MERSPYVVYDKDKIIDVEYLTEREVSALREEGEFIYSPSSERWAQDVQRWLFIRTLD